LPPRRRRLLDNFVASPKISPQRPTPVYTEGKDEATGYTGLTETFRRLAAWNVWI
jgi:hypothetical protein